MTTVLISGATGFIGGHLAAHLTARGWTVVGTGRRAGPPGSCSAWYVRPLGTSWADVFRRHEIGAVVHCAHDASPQNAEAAARGTVQWIEEAKAAGVARQIFLSSISARAGSRSCYGRTKHFLEGRAAESGGLVLRPGLVIGPGGLFARMVRAAQRLPLVPLIGGGRTQLYFTGIDALCEIIGRCLTAGPAAGTWNVQQPQPSTMQETLRTICVALGVRRMFLPIPYGLSLAASNVLQLGPLARAGIGRDNVIGLRENDIAGLPSDYAALGGRIEDLGTLVERAVRGGRAHSGPLSPWERVRVRVARGKTIHPDLAPDPSPHPLPLSQRERGVSGSCHGTSQLTDGTTHVGNQNAAQVAG